MSTFETNRSIINGFRELTDKSKISDASGWSIRLVYKYLLGYRNKLLFEKLRDKTYPISTLNSYVIPCIKLDDVSVTECPCSPKSNFTFKRSVYPIPNFIGNINSVNGGNRTPLFDYVEWDKFKYKLSSRFQAERDKPYWTIKRTKVNNVDGNYLYLYNDEFKENITISIIPTDPLDVYNYPSCDGQINKCFDPLDKEFIIDQQLIPLMYDMALNQLLKGKVSISDILNNNQDDVSNTKVPLK